MLFDLHLPTPFQKDLDRLWQTFQENASDETLSLLKQQPKFLSSLPKVWACSPFVANYCTRHPDVLHDLIESGDLFESSIDYAKRIQDSLLGVEEEFELMRQLRLHRQREMVRIAWRDLAEWANLAETLKSLSNLADALVESALFKVYQRLTQQFGIPCNEKGEKQQMVVLAMGKLGGQELNFSSDIDLIFAYPEMGETQTTGSRRARSNVEFFTRLGQQLIHVLNSITAEGFVFRVDMRLRPFGDSGPLVMHFDAIEEYYQNHARDWERYALIKARVIAGDKEAGEYLLKLFRPFIYRRYLDFEAFESLRMMKVLIDQETRRKGLENNIKLGTGGIREVEFICQVFQLIRGGRQPALQRRHLLKTLKKLEQYQLITDKDARELREAYVFLRLAENHLQAIEDRQTQTLPPDRINQLRLAYSMGFDEWVSFFEQLRHHQDIVHQQFEQVIAPISSEITQNTTIPSRWQRLWLQGLEDNENSENMLREAGFKDTASILSHLQQLNKIQKFSQRGRQRLDMLVPRILSIIFVGSSEDKDRTIHRILNLIETVAQRSVYLALLIERPQVLKLLINLFTHSEWIASQITRYPLLLDELLDDRRLYDPLKPNELDNALQAQLAYLPLDDLEMQMDTLRQFKRGYFLQVATAEISKKLSVEVASDYLTAIADTMLRKTLAMAWEQMTQRHGYPSCVENGGNRPAKFCIVAYGKAGGIELGYNSDLDIVFLHDSAGAEQMTNGAKPLDNNLFFIRLAQRIIHLITVNTPAGTLYEIDPRLRPGGTSGLLVSSLESFEDYQRDKAWTWEHQALVRARAVAGDKDCMLAFEEIRREILSLERFDEELKKDVIEMRAKMRRNLDKSDFKIFDIKQGDGGITDIEFIVQYGVLRWAGDYPDLLDTTGVLPALQKISDYQLFNESDCDCLSEAYRHYRAETHRLALQNKPAQIEASLFFKYRHNVTRIWKEIFLIH